MFSNLDPLSILLAVVVGLGLGWFMVRNKNNDYTKINEINKTDFKNNMRKGQLVDVRKKDEFEKNKIKGARNFRASELTGKYAKLRRDKSVYLYCNNGKKSKRVAKKLIRDNYKDVYVLNGGFENYNK